MTMIPLQLNIENADASDNPAGLATPVGLMSPGNVDVATPSHAMFNRPSVVQDQGRRDSTTGLALLQKPEEWADIPLATAVTPKAAEAVQSQPLIPESSVASDATTLASGSSL